ncbi:MAG: hypothetical protein J5792_06470 [Bacteroidales bacterium]|nr:hypothetical protein [Bacteroidales bacterium]
MSYTDEQDYQENESFDENGYQETEERPTFLMVLCILTFIGSGISLISNLVVTATYEMIPDMLASMKDYFEQAGTDIEDAQLLPKTGYLITALLNAVSIVGAAFMMGMRKLGFHIYTGAQALLLLVPVLIAHQGLNYAGLFFTVVFVTLYATFLKKMR